MQVVVTVDGDASGAAVSEGHRGRGRLPAS